MPDFHMNLSLSKWPKHSLHARATVNAGQPLDEVLGQLTGFISVLQSGELDIDFLRENVGSFVEAAFASGETHRFARTYGDDSALGEDWRLHIDAITPLEIARQDECLSDMFKDGERRDALQRMVVIDEELGLTEIPLER